MIRRGRRTPGGSVATADLVVGATKYMIQWMPIYNVFASKPPKTQSSGQGSFGWTIAWEEV